jgi:hypothetical protein
MQNAEQSAELYEELFPFSPCHHAYVVSRDGVQIGNRTYRALERVTRGYMTRVIVTRAL